MRLICSKCGLPARRGVVVCRYCGGRLKPPPPRKGRRHMAFLIAGLVLVGSSLLEGVCYAVTWAIWLAFASRNVFFDGSGIREELSAVPWIIGGAVFLALLIPGIVCLIVWKKKEKAAKKEHETALAAYNEREAAAEAAEVQE